MDQVSFEHQFCIFFTLSVIVVWQYSEFQLEVRSPYPSKKYAVLTPQLYGFHVYEWTPGKSSDVGGHLANLTSAAYLGIEFCKIDIFLLTPNACL